MTVFLWATLVSSWVMTVEHAAIAIWTAVDDAKKEKATSPIKRAIFSGLWFGITCGSFYFIVTTE